MILSAGIFYLMGGKVFTMAAENILNVIGFSWSDTVGWSEFRPRFGGVNVDISTGQLSGFAWSDNIGWIYFGPDTDTAKAGDAPQEPKEWAKIDLSATSSGSSDRIITGWARAFRPINPEGQTLGGWDGWISMSGTASNAQKSPYSVSVNLNNNEFSGWAWGSDVIGWISFNCSNRNECDVSHYKVTIGGVATSSASSSSSASSISSSVSSEAVTTGGGGGGGGGGGMPGGATAGNLPTPSFVVIPGAGATTTPPESREDLERRLNELKRQLIIALLKSKHKGFAEIGPAIFSRDMKFCDNGEDARALQIFLNLSGFTVAESGNGSPGRETIGFGNRTVNALARYQAANGISPAKGFFGPKTRAFIKQYLTL